jgi:hypothetical protein
MSSSWSLYSVLLYFGILKQLDRQLSLKRILYTLVETWDIVQSDRDANHFIVGGMDLRFKNDEVWVLHHF